VYKNSYWDDDRAMKKVSSSQMDAGNAFPGVSLPQGSSGVRQYGLPPHMAGVQRQLQKKKENVVNVAFARVRACIYI
jgi:hypothetical protein